jgi:hypothetical protein
LAPTTKKRKDKGHEPVRLKNFTFLTKSLKKTLITPKKVAVVLTSLDLVSSVFYNYYMYICLRVRAYNVMVVSESIDVPSEYGL